VVYSDPSRCGWSYAFNIIIVISGCYDVCTYVCVRGFCCCFTYVCGGVFSFSVSRCGGIVQLFGFHYVYRALPRFVLLHVCKHSCWFSTKLFVCVQCPAVSWVFSLLLMAGGGGGWFRLGCYGGGCGWGVFCILMMASKILFGRKLEECPGIQTSQITNTVDRRNVPPTICIQHKKLRTTYTRQLPSNHHTHSRLWTYKTCIQTFH
jgi:hypothetical protein